jgi:hypothetical protein
MDINKCEGCKCYTCSNLCQGCFNCLNAGESDQDDLDLYLSECDSYDS